MTYVPSLCRSELAEVSIVENASCEITQFGELVKLVARSTWSEVLSDLTRRYGVDALLLSDALGWKGSTLAFLNELPPLKWLSVGTDEAIDWGAIVSQISIKTLLLRHRGTAPTKVDFTLFANLHEATLQWWAAWDSILMCRSLRSLHLREPDTDGIDCTRLENLVELRIANGSLLRDISFAPGTELISCEIDHCPRLLPDFEKLRGVKFMRLVGRLAFDLEVLSQCQQLETLILARNGRVRVSFLGQLPNLRQIIVAPGTTLNAIDKAMVKRIAERSR